ncbi:MAG: NADPH dehydrogenase NamA [Thermoflavifilum aggregans]|nr:NADPH dehydrogenase NamA [Thermoflavifilum aggregans]
MSLLFEPFSSRGLQIRNRMMVSPMCQYSSEDGFANDWHLVHLGSRAVGGAGIVCTEATAVSPEGRITPQDLGIWKDEHIPGLRRITDFIKAQGAVPAIQLAHAGRKASTARPWEGGHQLAPENGGWQTVAPSAIPFREGERPPLALDEKGIEKVIHDFVDAAKRAYKAGFQVIELHAAHGYLLHEFFSPLSNHRTDAYGGPRENRARLLLQVTEAVRQVWPDEYPLFVRLSCTDWVEDGVQIEDCVWLAKELKARGVDLIDCSSGGLVPYAQVPAEPGYQVPFAERIRSEAGIATGAVGLITEARQAEEILQNQQADLIIMARQMLRDPYFALHAAIEMGKDIPWPVQYLRAKPQLKPAQA